MDIQNLKKEIAGADAILVGIGKEFDQIISEDMSGANKVLDSLNKLIPNENYFIVAECENCNALENVFNEKRIVNMRQPEIEGDKKWQIYNAWLMATLRNNLVILELGVGFENPNLIRWPFERVAFIGNGAKLIRVNKELSQVDVNLKDKAIGLSMGMAEFLEE